MVQALKTLYAAGGIPRFYSGLAPALIQVRGILQTLAATPPSQHLQHLVLTNPPVMHKQAFSEQGTSVGQQHGRALVYVGVFFFMDMLSYCRELCMRYT